MCISVSEFINKSFEISTVIVGIFTISAAEYIAVFSTGPFEVVNIFLFSNLSIAILSFIISIRY
jgi:hypothetical protein